MSIGKKHLRRFAAAAALSCILAMPSVASAQENDTVADNVARSCIAAGTGSMLLTLLPGIMTLAFDGGILLVSSIPVAVKIGAASCVSGAAGTVIADEIIGQEL